MPRYAAPLATQRALPVFLLLSTGTGIAAGILSVAMPLYALHLGASAAQTGLLRTVSGLGLLVAVVPAGLAVDRFGARAVFLAGSSGVALGLAACAMAMSPGVLALAMLGEAVCRGLQFGALAAAFLQMLPGLGLNRVGWHKAAVSLGISFVGPVLGGALLGRLSFAEVFAIAGALALAANLPLRALELPAPRGPGSAGNLRARVFAARHTLTALLRQRDVRSCLFAEALITATFSAFATFIVVLAVTARGLSAEAASWLAGIEGATYIATSFGAAAAVRRLSPPRALQAGALLTMPALAGLGTATQFAPLLLCASALGLGIGVLTLVITTRAGTLPGEKGRIMALFMGATSIGGAAGPALAAAVASGLGTPAVFLAFALCFAVLAASGSMPVGWPARGRHRPAGAARSTSAQSQSLSLTEAP